MDSRVQLFFRSMRGKRIAILGIGVSNTGLIKMLGEHGATITACDKRSREQLGGLADQLERFGATLRLGEGYLRDLDVDIVFRTPGMNFFLPELVALRQKGVAVTSEMEVFCDICPCPLIAVTGSDGKTTTTTLIAEMLRASGRTVHLGGNIGKALLPEIGFIQSEDVAVVELSSFQLISMRCAPRVSVITNVQPNHLDVHKDMAEYIGAKKNVFLHQNAFSSTVLNLDNDITADFATEVRGGLSWFSLAKPVHTGAYLDGDGYLCRSKNGEVERILPAAEIRLPGTHNVANYLAAIATTTGLVSAEAIGKVAREFGGVEHRIEFIRERNGVKWYNDSIATSPTRSIAGLLSFSQKLIIIAGGYDKKIPFEPLAPYIVERVKLLILTGLTADQIEAAIRADPGYTPGNPEILRATDLTHAVEIAAQRAADGDVVSLSPACASFDSYPNFEARGKHFKEMVAAL